METQLKKQMLPVCRKLIQNLGPGSIKNIPFLLAAM